MSVRRGATWLGTVCLLLGATVSWGAAPAVAEGESVRVRAPSTINAGGSPGSVSVNVSRRGGDCVNVRTTVGVRLSGLTADRVEVQVAADGDWRQLSVSAGADGMVVAQRTAPDRPELCARKSVSSRYRVSLLAGAPDGRVTVVAEAYTADGRSLGRGSDTAKVGGRTGVPAPTESAPEPVVPTETPAATEEAVAATQEVVAAVPDQSVAASETGGSMGIGGMVMTVGVVMVVIGIALLALLIRRGRTDRREPADGRPTGFSTPPRSTLYGGGAPTGGADPTMRLPGGGDRTVALPRSQRMPGQSGGQRMPAQPGGGDPTMMLPGGGDRTMALPGGHWTPAQSGGQRTPAQPAGDPTLILPGTDRRTSSRQARPVPPGQARPVSPAHPAPPAQPVSPALAQPVSPAPPISPAPPVPPAQASPGQVGAASPGQVGAEPARNGPVPPGQPPPAGPDATLILPTNPPPR